MAKATDTSPTSKSPAERRQSEYRARCTICAHPDRARIETAMARGAGKRAVGKAYDVSVDAVARHFKNHVGEAVKVARRLDYLKPGATLSKLRVEEDLGLLESLQTIRAGLFYQFDLAMELDDRSACASLASQLHKNLEIVGKQTGELRRHDTMTVTNLVLMPDYLDLRLRLVQALRAHPEAARDVAAVFRTTEAGATAQMISAPVIEGEMVAARG